MTSVAFTQAGLPVHVSGWAPIPVREANALLEAWGHYLGPVARPFGAQAWCLDVDGRPVSVAVSSSIVSPTVAGFRRDQVVELSRLCSAPGAGWATRVAVRLWREIAAWRWPYWPPAAAVAYSHNDRHDGRIYRHDGWQRASTRCGAPPGPNSTWSRGRDPAHPAHGRKTLWIWRYDTTEAGV